MVFSRDHFALALGECVNSDERFQGEARLVHVVKESDAIASLLGRDHGYSWVLCAFCTGAWRALSAIVTTTQCCIRVARNRGVLSICHRPGILRPRSRGKNEERSQQPNPIEAHTLLGSDSDLERGGGHEAGPVNYPEIPPAGPS